MPKQPKVRPTKIDLIKEIPYVMSERARRVTAAGTALVLVVGALGVRELLDDDGNDQGPVAVAPGPSVTSPISLPERTTPSVTRPDAAPQPTTPPAAAVNEDCSLVGYEPANLDETTTRRYLQLIVDLGKGEAEFFGTISASTDMLQAAFGDPELAERLLQASDAADVLTPESPLTYEQFQALSVEPVLVCDNGNLTDATASSHYYDTAALAGYVGAGYEARAGAVGWAVIGPLWDAAAEAVLPDLDEPPYGPTTD